MSLNQVCVGTCTVLARGRCCLELEWELQVRSSSRPSSVVRPCSDCLHGPARSRFLPSVLPFRQNVAEATIERTPGLLPSLKRRPPGEAFAPSRRSAVSASLMGLATSGTVPPGRRGTFTGQSYQPLCEGETTRHLESAHRVTVPLDEQVRTLRTRRFITLRSLAPILGRNVIPPSLVRRGPFRRLLPPDADTDSPKGELQTDFPDRYGPARVGFGSRSCIMRPETLTV